MEAALDFCWNYYHVISYGAAHYLLQNANGLHDGEEHVIISCSPISTKDYMKLIKNNLVEDYTAE
jgi:hypothetical protein